MFGKKMIVGDIHLGKGASLGKTAIGSLYNTRYLDQIFNLDWIIQQVKFYDIETIFFTGDIFEDSKPDYILVQAFIEFLKELDQCAIEWHIIVGNHDLKRVGDNYYSILQIMDSANFQYGFIHKNIYSFDDNEFSFTLIPFLDRKMLSSTQEEALQILQSKIDFENQSLSSKSIKILIGHLALEGSLYVGDEIDDLMNELFCPLSFFKNYDYVWMGHIHKPQVLSKKPHLAHIGSLDVSNFSEANHKKILVILDSSLSEKFFTIEVPTRPLKSISIEVPELSLSKEEKLDDSIFNEYYKSSTKYILDQLDKLDLMRAIVKIEIKLQVSSPNLQREEIEKFIYGKGAHYICAFSESRKSFLHKKDKAISNTIDPFKAITLWADKNLPEEKRSKYIATASETIKNLKIS